MESTTALRQRFHDLVRKAELEVAENPKRYKLKLAALAALGYGVIFLLLAVLIVLLGGTLYGAFFSTAFLIILIKKKIIIVLAMAIWLLVKSLFVRIKAPEGLRLAREDYPALWREIDDLRNKLKALPVHNVVMVPDMNAAVAQTPRLGLFGPCKNTLVLGLELLMTLSPAQARAVLGHEFGHLSGEHGRFGNWIYRKRLTWARIGSVIEGEGGASVAPMSRFINWYVPRLAGYSFALARQQEYEADAVAAGLSSKEDAAAALVLVQVRDAITREEFWKPLLKRAIADPEPETETFTRLFHYLKSSNPNPALAEAKIAEAMRGKTDFTDTHPALRDRLEALATYPSIGVNSDTAAEHWLGARLGEVLSHFDRQWHEANADAWRNRHAMAAEATERLKTLSAKPAGDLTQIEFWNVAALTEEFMPGVDPLPIYRAYAKKYPDDADGPFTIGRILLLDRRDAAGLPFMEQAAENRAHREPACGLIAAYFRSNGNAEAAEHWLRQAEAAFDANVEARAERNGVTAQDTYQPARLDEHKLKALAAAIKATSAGGKIKHIWIAEKTMKHLPEHGLFVVVVEPHFFSWGKDEIGQKLASELQNMIELPDTWFFVPAVRQNRALTKKIKAAGSQIA